MLVGTISNFRPDDWDRLVAAIPPGISISSQSSISTNWAKAVHQAEDYYLQVYNDKKPVLIAKFYYYPDLLEHKNLLIKKHLRGLGNLICINGPLFLDESVKSNEAFECFLKLVKKLEKRKKPSSTTIYFPYSLNGDNLYTIDTYPLLSHYKFTRSSWATLFIDLQKDEEDIWNSLHNSIRTAVRKCIKEECKVKKITTENEYKELYLKYYNGWSAYKYPPDKVRKIWALKPNNKDYYIAMNKSGNVVYSGISVSAENGIAGIGNMFLTEQAKIDKIPSHDFLLWHLIQQAKQQGDLYFDLSGINPNPTTDKEKSIQYFKKKFSDRMLEYDILTKTGAGKFFSLYMIFKQLISRIKCSYPTQNS